MHALLILPQIQSNENDCSWDSHVITQSLVTKFLYLLWYQIKFPSNLNFCHKLFILEESAEYWHLIFVIFTVGRTNDGVYANKEHFHRGS